VAPATPIYLEKGKRRVFAAALDWPGWCRSARTEDDAVRVLFDYAPRYADAIAEAPVRFSRPRDVSYLEVVERLKGNATTDFGAPAVAPSADEEPVPAGELRRLVALLQAGWSTIDAAAKKARSKELRKGPRGGGRELEAIVEHVVDAEAAYLPRLGGRFRRDDTADLSKEKRRLRALVIEALSARARGEPLPADTRIKTFWTPRYFVRRAAWHALDHAWEIEDRSSG
jgi:hypothetical protein